MLTCRVLVRTSVVLFWTTIAAVTALSRAAQAQLPQTRLYAVFPPGAQAGQTVDVTVTNGADLDEISAMRFNHPGITATHKSGNTFSVEVAPSVEPGVYECRVTALYGTSNPRSFVIGRLPEIIENNANATTEQAQEIQIGSVINGRADGGADVDFYKFSAKKGQRILAECAALSIDSRFHGELRLYSNAGRRLGRAVAELRRSDPLLDVTIPEDGEYFLRVTDFVYAGNNDYFYRLKVHTGPHIDYLVPPTGVPGSKAKYTVFGRNLPGSQPAGIGSDGRQLEKLDVDITLPQAADQLQFAAAPFSRESDIDGTSWSFTGANGSSNSVLISFSPRPAVLEVEPNDEATKAQKITVPAEICGQFQQRADIDYFEFDAKAQQAFWIDVFARRLGGSADPYLTIDQITKKDDGTETVKRLASQDDIANTGIANLFDLDSDDVSYRFVAPADSLYRISLRDRFFESRGAPDLQYHLAIREEQPDFRLAVIPPAPLQNNANGYQTWAIGLRKGENLQVEVAALRRHGFKGDITVKPIQLPPGVTAAPVVIGSEASSATLVFSAAENATAGTWPLSIAGEAKIDSPDAVAAVAAAEAALKSKQDAIPNLDKVLAATVDPLNKAADAKNKAAEAAKADAAARDKTAAEKTAAEKALADAKTAAQQADETVKAADTKVAEAKKALADAVAAEQAAQQALDKDKENQGLKDALAAATKVKTDAEAAAKTAEQTLAELKKKQQDAAKVVQDTTVDAQKKTQAFAQAEAKAKQSDAALQAATKAQDAEVVKNKAATDAKNAGVAAVSAAEKELLAKQQARDAAVRNVSHAARTATVVWNGSNVEPAHTRLSHELTLSVMDELSPYQATTPVGHETVAQNRSLLVPVKLAKREGFDDKVQLTFQNVPKNVNATNVAIEKGSDTAIARLDIANNAAEGTYTLYLQAQGKVKYSMNPVRLERATASQKAADDAFKAAQEAAKKATDTATTAQNELTEATKVLTDAQNKVKTEQANLTKAQAAEKPATDAKTKADAVVTDAAAKAATAAKALDEATAAANADAANEDLKKKQEAAAAAKTAADEGVKKAQEAQQAAAKALTDAQTATKTATETVAAAEKQVADAQAAVTQKTTAKQQADAAKKTADDAVKAEDAKKKAADKELDDAKKYAAAKDVNVYAPTTPIVVTITKGAFTLAANVPNGGALKQGQSLEIKVTAKRINGFTGPITVSLAMPPGSSGLSADAVTIPADQTEATLKIVAAGDAPEGQIANLFIRGTSDWNGPTSADAAITVKVQK
ncbi:hypothetical protein GC176_10735 [bacterium]|nr:hypothetical protein [bacterium]